MRVKATLIAACGYTIPWPTADGTKCSWYSLDSRGLLKCSHCLFSILCDARSVRVAVLLQQAAYLGLAVHRLPEPLRKSGRIHVCYNSALSAVITHLDQIYRRRPFRQTFDCGSVLTRSGMQRPALRRLLTAAAAVLACLSCTALGRVVRTLCALTDVIAAVLDDLH